MEAPLVSVHMITYNHAPYIAQAIEGVLRQKTNFPFELVIGEDCSTDGTREIVFNYQKKYPNIIKVITSSQNVGATRNSYRTTKACRGKYIAFCEGDDYWHNPEKLQKQVNYLEIHPECGLVFADCDVYYCKSKKIIRSFNHCKGFCSPANLDFKEIIWSGIVVFTCTVMMRLHLFKTLIKADPFLHQDGNFLMGDQQLWIEISLISLVSYMPECLGTYRVLTESASRSKDSKKMWRFYNSVNEMRLYLCNKHKFSDNLRKRIESELLDSSLRLAFFERNYALAAKVKKEKHVFTLTEWIRYLGAKYILIHYGYILASKVSNFIKQKDVQWP